MPLEAEMFETDYNPASLTATTPVLCVGSEPGLTKHRGSVTEGPCTARGEEDA